MNWFLIVPTLIDCGLSWKNSFLTVSNLREGDDLEMNWFLTVSSLGACDGLDRTDI